MIIDCHGHTTTAPKQHELWWQQQIEAHAKGARAREIPMIGFSVQPTWSILQ
jgi:hypothetical protein